VISLRNGCTGHWPVHFFKESKTALAALLIAAAPLSVIAATPAVAQAQVRAPVQILPASQTVADFYKARKDAPLWLAPAAGDSAEQLLSLLDGASVDSLDPAKYHVAELRQALDAARSGKRKHVVEADKALSAAFVSYVQDLRHDPGVGITYVDPDLKPSPPSPLAVLLTAAAQPSLADYVSGLGWMHPIYGQLRQALAKHSYSTDHQRELLQLNLQRARALPPGKQPYVVVNAAQQRLYMYDGGKPVDSMVVVVGKPKWPTPMLTAYIRYAALNPYWYVPPDLAG
jgi:murein L,D-transpeptidase YcbB/YkuD